MRGRMNLDPISEKRHAQHMVIRVLLTDLYVALCMSTDDPLQDAKRRAKITLGAMDSLLDDDASMEFFTHSAIHEMETFWTAVESKIQARLSAGLP